MSTKREQVIKGELANYKPTEDEKLVIKSALFNLISLCKKENKFIII
jgi:hypothetical protein